MPQRHHPLCVLVLVLVPVLMLVLVLVLACTGIVKKATMQCIHSADCV